MMRAIGFTVPVVMLARPSFTFDAFDGPGESADDEHAAARDAARRATALEHTDVAEAAAEHARAFRHMDRWRALRARAYPCVERTVVHGFAPPPVNF